MLAIHSDDCLDHEQKGSGGCKTAVLMDTERVHRVGCPSDHVLKQTTPVFVSLTELCVFFYSLLLPNLETLGSRGLEVIVPLAGHSARM